MPKQFKYTFNASLAEEYLQRDAIMLDWGYNMHAFKERFAFICQTQNLYYTDRPMKSGLN